MVLCRFFQQGACRFGSKCQNEHINLKEVLKVDVEAAINGRQWPFSCFGPFKDKPCLPNFIEDQSFDEVRYLCYEAKQKNFFSSFHQQFNKEAQETTNKIKALLQLTPEVIEIVAKVYDTPVENSVSANKNNPFGLGTGTVGNNSSIFGKSSATTSNQPAGGNLFGGASIFGGGNNGVVQAGQSIFGGGGNAMQQQQKQASIFGQSHLPASNPIFGGSASQTSIFAQQPQPQQMNMTNSGGGGLFAQASHQIQQQQQPQQQSNGFGLFAAAAQQTAPLFGQVPPVFAQPMGVFSTPAKPVEASGLFAAAAAETQQNIFAQSQPQLQQPPSGFFQQPPPPAGINCISSIYSRLEDLTADEIEAFKADAFSDGKIPFSPPPRELIR